MTRFLGGTDPLSVSSKNGFVELNVIGPVTPSHLVTSPLCVILRVFSGSIFNPGVKDSSYVMYWSKNVRGLPQDSIFYPRTGSDWISPPMFMVFGIVDIPTSDIAPLDYSSTFLEASIARKLYHWGDAGLVCHCNCCKSSMDTFKKRFEIWIISRLSGTWWPVCEGVHLQTMTSIDARKIGFSLPSQVEVRKD